MTRPAHTGSQGTTLATGSIVTPIFVGKLHLSNLHCGQFFCDDDVVGEHWFAAQAERFGYDTKAYLAAHPRHSALRVRERDIVARLGGDEFVVVLPGLESGVHVVELDDNTVRHVTAPYAVVARELRTAAPSIGICFYLDGATGIDDLIRNADIAVYRAKEVGRGNYQFDNRVDHSHGEVGVDLGLPTTRQAPA